MSHPAARGRETEVTTTRTRKRPAQAPPPYQQMSRKKILVALREHLECPISRDLMADPRITITGQTYDHAAIAPWFGKRRVGQDPVTGAQVTTELLPNLVVARLVERFADEFATLSPNDRADRAPVSRSFAGLVAAREHVGTVAKRALTGASAATQRAATRVGHATAAGISDMCGATATALRAHRLATAAGAGAAIAAMGYQPCAAALGRLPLLPRASAAALQAVCAHVPGSLTPHGGVGLGVPGLIGGVLGAVIGVSHSPCASERNAYVRTAMLLTIIGVRACDILGAVGPGDSLGAVAGSILRALAGIAVEVAGPVLETVQSHAYDREPGVTMYLVLASVGALVGYAGPRACHHTWSGG